MSTAEFFTARNNPSISLSAALPPPVKRPQTPIELSLARTRLVCGSTALRIDINVSNGTHKYTIGVYAGFEGGGREPDMTLAPRAWVSAASPKMVQPATGLLVEAWPRPVPVERRIDGVRISSTAFPEGSVPQRLESAFMRVEPLLRQLVNQRQIHMDQGGVESVADQPLVARIKSILTGF